jgi:hypothetical protein
MVDDSTMTSIFEHVCVLYLFFSQVLYIYPRMSCMILMVFGLKFVVLYSYDLLSKEIVGGWLWPLLHCW